ncbi:MAG: N-acetylmuramoyl-L-alanine amidase [Gemmatimonadota bacterium]|nr:N-acetylmuramoyl-L-alanine amidase [Gemmatimonadota bacterium]
MSREAMVWTMGGVVLGLWLGAGSVEAQAQPDLVEASVGGRSARVAVSRHHGFAAVNAGDLSPIWSSSSSNGTSLRAEFLGREILFEAGSPFFRHAGSTFQLANPTYRWGGAFWIPAEFVERWLPARAGAVALAADRATGTSDPLPARVDPDAEWRVVIDPGHGGHDPGTLGRRSREKDVVLAISRMLHEELRERERIEPYLTREGDVYVAHDVRSALAVERGGDLFVSIHANGVNDARARGFETIFLGPARSEEARQVALRENRGPSVEESAGSTGDLAFILTGLDRTENLDESRRFAGFVQNAIREARGGRSPDRGVKQGPWWVLLGALARMPSVIVEVGFLSNESEERFLTSADGQRLMARAIADAIVAYRRDLLERYAGPRGEGAG